MKLSIYHPRRIKYKSAKGFALIATMILMILLAAVAVVLMAIAANQNRISMSSTLIAAARQQALVGLDVAIGELQGELGPDQRVSASSGIMANPDESEPEAAHILGVWNSWDGPLYGASKSGYADSISETYDNGRTVMFRRWLISTRGDSISRQAESYKDIATRRQGQRICLIGEGTLGKTTNSANYVYADLVSMPSSGKNTAEMAWWVGGENQKANASVENPEETDDTIEILHRTWNTPAPIFSSIESLSFMPNDMTGLSGKILSVNSLPLVTRGSQDAGAPYFFDVTAKSQSLPINVRTGGFKQDLCLLLDKEKLSETDFARRTTQDCPMVEYGDGIPESSNANRPIGSWQILHAFYHTWPDGTASDADNFTGRLLGSVDAAYTRQSGSCVHQTSNEYRDINQAIKIGVSYYDTKTLLDEGMDEAGYPRTPTLLAFMHNLALGITTDSADPTTSYASGFTASDTFVPEDYYIPLLFPATMVLWWNPYNVPMKIRGRQLSSNSMPYRMAAFQCRSNEYRKYQADWQTPSGVTLSSDEVGEFYWGTAGLRLTVNAGSYGAGYETGAIYVKDEAADDKDIEFAPGEILFFSPMEGQIHWSDDYGADYNSIAIGYRSDKVNNTPFDLRAEFKSAARRQEDEKYQCTISNMSQGNIKFCMRYPIAQPLSDWASSNYYYLSSASSETVGGYSAAQQGSTYPSEFEVFSARIHYTTPSETSGPVAGNSLDILRPGQSPYFYQVGWFEEEEVDDNTEDAYIGTGYWQDLATLQDTTNPYFVASVGITAKSANNTLFPRFIDGDFRTKIWQHSSPVLGGDMLMSPDNSERTYHPYHISNIETSAGMGSSPMSNIGDNGYFGINEEGEKVSFIAAFELPVHPPFSLAAFSGMKLIDGWYDSGTSDEGSARPMNIRCQRGVPSVGIGNSFADPTISADAIYENHENNILPYPSSHSNNEIFEDYYDHGFLVNDALWDRFFCSSLSTMPEKSGSSEAKDTLSNFLSGDEDLPVARYKKASSNFNDEAIIERVMEDDGWKYIAQYLVIDGGFNVNSTSVNAWAATLMGLANRKLVSNVSEGELTIVEPEKDDSSVLFSRFMLSTTDKSIDSLGDYSPMEGSATLRQDSGLASAWGEVRLLSADGILSLAEEIVKQVRKRGPFLNMAEFINRRLDSSTKEYSLKGALQAAIDETDINEAFNEVMLDSGSSMGGMYNFGEADEGSAHSGAPGYLIQSDILSSLGNILTVRDDTFIIRAYGCVKNPKKAILAQAWCEATVQRTSEYLDPTNAIDDSVYLPDGTAGKGLSEINTTFGRKFRVVSFRWLDHWDI